MKQHAPSAAKYSLPPHVAEFAKRISCVLFSLYATLTPPTTNFLFYSSFLLFICFLIHIFANAMENLPYTLKE